MKLLVFVLNKTDKLDEILTKFLLKKICDATVLDSMGMAKLLANNHSEEEIPYLTIIKPFIKTERKKSKLILAAIEDDKLKDAIEAIESVIGDLSKQDTGVVFSLPIDFAKGICKIGEQNNN